MLFTNFNRFYMVATGGTRRQQRKNIHWGRQEPPVVHI